MRSIVFLLLGIPLAFAGTHSMLFFCTAVYNKTDIQKYTVFGMVDDQQFMSFDSNTMKAVPKSEWVRQNEGEEEYWNGRTQHVISYYQKYESSMHLIIGQNHESMSDIHTFQMMYGCELEDNDSRGYLQFGYNGEDFISFDKNTLTWTAANPKANDLRDQWQNNTAQSEYWKTYMENTCFERMQKVVNYTKNTLERKVAPQVYLLQKNSSSPVICHATGFYPQNITMTWKTKQEDHYEYVEVSSTLPNADGTFQKSISLSVKSEEWKKNPDVYRCVIQHVAAEKEIVVPLNENNIKSNSASDNFIVKCLVSVTVAVVVGCVLALIAFAVKKKLTVYKMSTEVMSKNPTVYVKGSATDTAFEITDEPLQN